MLRSPFSSMFAAALFALVGCSGEAPVDTADTDADADTDTDTDTDTDSDTDTDTDTDCVPTTEACNGVDDDCDGDVDEAGSTGETTYFPDLDGDGYGDMAPSVNACSAPDGYVLDNTDCDDGDDQVFPGQPEIANDGDDNDCDPSTTIAMNLYDAFSTTANPSGEWTLGYATGPDGSGFTAYAQYGEFDASVDYWETSGVEGARVYRNHTDAVWSYSSVSFAPHALALHPGATGEFSIVRWTAPVDTQCQVDVVFDGRDSTTTVVATYFGGVLMTEGEITGVGVTVPIEGAFRVAAGETVDFSVGMNGNYVYDSTGLEGTLTCR